MTTKIIKILTGIVIVPLSVIGKYVWEWWEKKERGLFAKILTAPIILPLALFLLYAAPWWEEYK